MDNINIEKTSADIKSGLEKAISLLSYTNTSPIGINTILECSQDGKIVGWIPATPVVNPIMNGSVNVGTWQNGLARADHVHPSDTSKANISSPDFGGWIYSTGIRMGHIAGSPIDPYVEGDDLSLYNDADCTKATGKLTGASTFVFENSYGTTIVKTPSSSDHATNKDYVDTADGLKANAANPVFTGTVTSPKVMLTSEGGIAVKMTNKSGSTIAKGRIVEPYSATGGFRLAQLEAWNPIGITYDATIANDADGWVVVSGIADVYYSVSSTIGNVARVGMTADTGEVAGEAISDAAPTNDAIHFREIGHPIQTRVGAGLALTILHFN